MRRDTTRQRRAVALQPVGAGNPSQVEYNEYQASGFKTTLLLSIWVRFAAGALAFLSGYLRETKNSWEFWVTSCRSMNANEIRDPAGYQDLEERYAVTEP